MGLTSLLQALGVLSNLGFTLRLGADTVSNQLTQGVISNTDPPWICWIRKFRTQVP